MSATVPILQDLTAHIQAALPNLEVRLFPDRPSEYRFMHPVGAVLVQYSGSQFEPPRALQTIVQQRSLKIHLTVFGRNLHHDFGTLDLLDKIRLAVVGHRPVDCSPIHLLSEGFLDETAGAWQYELRLQTETEQIQVCQPDNRPRLTSVYVRQDGDPLNPHIQPKGNTP